jgi:hypothetical protein
MEQKFQIYTQKLSPLFGATDRCQLAWRASRHAIDFHCDFATATPLRGVEVRTMSLVDWHLRLHWITGSMALSWARATPSELVEWAHELRAIAQAMETAASTEAPLTEAEPQTPDWLLETA